MGASYREGPFYCGSCLGALEFMTRTWPVPGAWYVHRDDHRYHCHGRLSGTHTASALLRTRRDGAAA